MLSDLCNSRGHLLSICSEWESFCKHSSSGGTDSNKKVLKLTVKGCWVQTSNQICSSCCAGVLFSVGEDGDIPFGNLLFLSGQIADTVTRVHFKCFKQESISEHPKCFDNVKPIDWRKVPDRANAKLHVLLQPLLYLNGLYSVTIHWTVLHCGQAASPQAVWLFVYRHTSHQTFMCTWTTLINVL